MTLGITIDDAVVETYCNEGVVVLRGVLSIDEIESLRQGIDAVLAHPSPRAKVASQSDDPGFFLEDFCTWRDHAEFDTFIRNTALVPIAAQLMQSRTVRLYHDHVLVKEAGTRQRTPWHQDQPYYDVEGFQNVSFWIPVDPVPIESSLESVAGTHRGPWLMPRTFRDQQAKWFPEGSLAELPDIEADRSAHAIRAWDLERGDVIAFHMLTVHGAAGSAHRRRVFSLRLLGDDMVHAPRHWLCSPDFRAVIPEEDDQRRAGETLDGEWFPLLLG